MSEVAEQAKAAAPVTNVVPLKRDLILNPARMSLAEQWRQDWVVNAEAGTAVEDVLTPGYWSHMAAQIQQYDHIEVRLETGEWVLELLVVAVGRNYAQVYLKQQYDLVAAVKVDTPEAKHKVLWRGPQHKHAVVRIVDNEVLMQNFAKAAEAQAWLENHENITSRP